MQKNAQYEKTKQTLLGLFIMSTSKTSVTERIQENILDYRYNRIKLLNKVHIEYIVEATNIILRDVTHTER